MYSVDLIVALVLASAVLAGLARVIGVHYAIVLVLGGLALGFVPGIPAPKVDPDAIFFVFLPPLVYAASFGSSTQDLRENARPITALAIGLVLATMAAVGVVAHAAAGIGWGSAMVLGAILGPTDPVAATSVLRRVGAPDRTSTILEGESLVNDGTGLTVYALAVSAVVTGHFSFGSGVLRFIAVAAGGVAIGLAAGWISARIRRRIDEPRIEISISLLTAYLAYIPADRVGASGILAAVAAGLYAGSQSTKMLSPTSRLQLLGFWEVLTFLLESVLFLLIGLQLGHVVDSLGGGIGDPLLQAGAVVLAVIGIRMAWMFAAATLVRVVDARRSEAPGRLSRGEQVVLGWSGMRGGVSLAAALALPIAAGSHPFPARELVIFLAYVAIVVTLVGPGLTLAPLVRRLGIAEGEQAARAEAEARVELANTALRHLDETIEHKDVEERVVGQLRGIFESRIQRLEPQVRDDAQDGSDTARVAGQARELRRELIRAQRRRLAELRREGEISAEAMRRIERDLDLDSSRIAR